MRANQTQLFNFIDHNFDRIVWDKKKMYLKEAYLENRERIKNIASLLLKASIKKSLQGMLGIPVDKDQSQFYDFTVLTYSLTLGKGLGFGELALMSS